MDLTRSSYFSPEAEREFMGRSQYLGFLQCEAQAVAKLRGEWVEEPSTAFLIGAFLHSWNEGTLSEFMSEHPECFKKDGNLKTDYQAANTMIETLKSDSFAMYTLEGQKEVVFTAEFAGAKWKVMLDVYNPERRRIVDLKTTRSITEHIWNAEYQTKLSFVEQYDYLTQAALYAEIERRANGRPEEDWFSFYLVAMSKQDVPDKEVIDMRSPERYRDELARIEANMPRVLAVKRGEVEPKRCETCSYCRATKRLTHAKHWSEL